MQDAAERHMQFQQIGQLGLGIPAQKFSEPCYTIDRNCTAISSSSHVGYVEQCSIPGGYFPNTEPIDSASRTWRGCAPAPDIKTSDNKQCTLLTNTKKQWESVGTIASAPDSGVCIEEDHSLLAEERNRILQWMEQGEKEAQPLHLQQPAVNTKNTRTKRQVPGQMDQGTLNVQPIAQDPLMPPLPQPDSRNTLEEASRRLTQKNGREKRSRSQHHKSR